MKTIDESDYAELVNALERTFRSGAVDFCWLRIHDYPIQLKMLPKGVTERSPAGRIKVNCGRYMIKLGPGLPLLPAVTQVLGRALNGAVIKSLRELQG